MTPFKRTWQFIGWLISRPAFWLIRLTYKSSRRVRVAIIVNNEVLSVRNWMGDRNWRLPGGGVKPGEEPKDTVIRELNEELGLSLVNKRVERVATAETRESGVDFIAEYFIIRLPEKPTLKLKALEVMGVNWQPLKGRLNKVLKAQLKFMKVI